MMVYLGVQTSGQPHLSPQTPFLIGENGDLEREELDQNHRGGRI